MNIPFACIVAASAIPYLLTVIAKTGGARRGVGYDNSRPREFLQKLEGWPQRANWAQQNAFETLPLFIGAVLMASYAHVPQATIDLWAVVFVLARIVYSACYLLDLAALRTLVWGVATLAVLRLMVAAI